MGMDCSLNILLADDDPDDRLLFQEGLEETGCPAKLVQIEDGREVLDYLFGRGRYAGKALPPRPDIIFLDLNMPRANGYEVLNEIAGPGFRDVFRVVWTTNNEQRTVDLCIELGADMFFTKPMRFSGISPIIHKVMDAYARARRQRQQRSGRSGILQ